MPYEAQVISRPRGDVLEYRTVVWMTDGPQRVFVALSPLSTRTRDRALEYARLLATRHRDQRWPPFGDLDGLPVTLDLPEPKGPTQ